jgi:hypothetical protein
VETQIIGHTALENEALGLATQRSNTFTLELLTPERAIVVRLRGVDHQKNSAGQLKVILRIVLRAMCVCTIFFCNRN